MGKTDRGELVDKSECECVCEMKEFRDGSGRRRAETCVDKKGPPSICTLWSKAR